MTVVTGWELGRGPCGPSCSVSDIGWSTDASRHAILSSTGNKFYFGQWATERKDLTKNVYYANITDYVNANITGRVTNVNVPIQWIQEIAEFDLKVEVDTDYIDIVLSGDSWMDVNLQTCRLDAVTGRCRYHLQQKIRPGIRNDTKLPNNSPMILLKPVYRIKLNQETVIPLTLADKDGDKLRCRQAIFVEAGAIAAIKNSEVTKDCKVIIRSYESDGFRDKDWGIINLIVQDVNVKDITMGAKTYVGLKSSLGQSQVQFLVQTVANLTSPEFVAPTRCVSPIGPVVASYFVYAGTSLRIQLLAKPSNESSVHTQIDHFFVTTLPYRFVTVLPVQDVNQQAEKVRQSEILWHVGTHDKGQHILQAIAVDNQGYDSNDCSFDIEVEVVDYAERNHTNTGPYFPFFPKPSSIRCLLNSYCTFPIYATTSDCRTAITSIGISSTSLGLSHQESLWVGSVTHKALPVFQGDITLVSGDMGTKNICVQAKDSNSKTAVECLDVSFFGPGPCFAEPCSEHGVCVENSSMTDGYFCHCFTGFTGTTCDTELDLCSPGYCGNNAEKCLYMPDISSLPLCLCKSQWTGHKCDIAVQARRAASERSDVHG